MKQIVARIICVISIILIISVSGCVAPSKDNKTTSQTGNFFNPDQPTTETTQTPGYVTEVTPFYTATPTSGYRTILPTTLIPQDKYCRIYSTTNTYAYNKTAIAFNLRNPPMYINYTVKPSNYTDIKVVDSKLTGGGEQVLTIDTYSPYSWFEVTVRNRTGGEIYLQDGFGTRKYTVYLNRTLKVLKRDDMQIEFAGNNITATAMIWVKPDANIDDTSQFNMTTDCAYFDSNPRDFVQVGTTSTPRPTWTA
ncbi:MAG: hypothetical protein M0Q91_06180 [Methanoregula sp.]|jgi:hypothetical protein|nr:hypothetical protein [Methanoregula sp.]